MAARSSRQSPASTGKRRRDASEENAPSNATRKRFKEGETTLEQAEPYRILTARMPVDALTAHWSVARNRPIQEKHVDALYTIFQRGDMKRASYPLAVLSTRSEVQCMLHEMGYGGDTPDADDVPSFGKWLPNRRPAELLDGQHRVTALKRLVSNTGAGKQELCWPCNFYDRDALPRELNLKLRMNRRDPTLADSHGDIWVQLATAASERPGIFHGTVDEMKEQMLDALRLSSDTSFPLTRLVIIWRNERWRQMTTRWCETTVGRATFQITTWDWMICHRTDDFWFMAFRQVLGTLAQLPGDAAKLVSSEDWKKMSASLGAERTQEQVQELFYPRQSGKPLSTASKRNRKLLPSFDDGEYWDIYDRVLRTPALRFPDIHRITGLSRGNGRVLFQVLDQVVSWVNRERTGVNRGSNTKPQLRLDLEQKLDYYTPTRLRQAEKRVKIFHASATPQLPRQSASVLLQQEVLEFVLEHLAAFNAPKMRDYLNDGDPDSDLYAARFREDTWAGVLKIVRWHVSECRPKWLPVEGSDKPPEAKPSTQAANLTDAFCNYAAGLAAVREDKGLYSKPRQSASVLLQQEVLEFVLEHLAAFNAPKMRDYLNDGDPDSDLYAARFREDTWAGVLKIVRWHVSECRPKWLPVEGSDKPPEAKPSTQAANLTDAFCNYAAGLAAVREDKGLYSKLQSSAFRTALATWLSEQCGGELDSEDMQPGDGARGSRGPHAKDDGSTVVVAAAVAAKSLGDNRPVVDPKPAARPAAKEAAKPTAKPDATREAPEPQVDGPRCMADGRPPDRDGRRKTLTDKGAGERHEGARGKCKVNGQHGARHEKRSGRNTTPQRHGVGLRGLVG
ncbi:hypothetical protein PCL_09483 [Purpureocillium lilacinum]|uniref:DGQHR domain-containing protein n=1 Tax=Purpureocillium lilacinum TaxID=33203 RepID=A0A2U3DQU3_PURLI|nr:hypothetical protein PCL_09483 [Purpureocillium lilacinum]